MNKWKINTPDKDIAGRLAQSCGVTSLTAAALVARGYSSAESVIQSLSEDSLSDPFLLKDMQEAVDTVISAMENDELICIYGDYDCDGIMSTVILYTYLLENGANVMYYIPERSEGYGLNKEAVRKIHNDGANLIITVDNGISAISEAEYIYELGMKLVVTDHHQQGEKLPKAEAVVDPHRHDCYSPFKYSCGAVVALKLVTAINEGDYTLPLEQFGDLAAIATIADIVSLTGENRFITSYGLELVNNTDRPALIALKEVSGYADKTVDSGVVGFGLAPRINASGRFGSPKTAVKLLLCEDYEEALPIAQELDRLNNARKEAENKIVSEIYAMIDENPSLIHERAIFICGKDWHHGVIGIVASRIMEKFGKPCFIASEENGEIRGSARSFGSFSIFDALTYASDSLEKFGGHPAAGGFTIKSGMAEDFRRLVNKYAFENHRIMPVYEITADVPVQPVELTVENVQGLEILEPFGTGNEKPLFFIENAVIIDMIPLSKGIHTKLRIKFGNTFADALIFRKTISELTVRNGDSCDMIVNLGINEFRDKVSVNIYIRDIRPHGLVQNKYFSAYNVFEAFLRNEEIPENYYPAMYPTRDMTATIYKHIPDEGIVSDVLYIRLNIPQINYCRFCTAIEAMRQLGLITVSSVDSVIWRVRNAPRTDLNSAPILVSLREKNKINK
ncbi:MAG: single-stranded-DNA-specific exonuclease RecJ [Ruminococcus flavefaciens]|nr:single-stranded-DNA-specific exonuclease RecJ [Ruminococcus flavefaciens]MCM1230301.1 single-stranded-DNA-specific exonuclease RecJ [Ruminococcus flavefaciens]